MFAYDDEYAMLLMRALQDTGVDLPAETAVIGADDLILGGHLRPRLGSVRTYLATTQPLAEMIDRLVQNPGGTPERHFLLRAEAVAREST